MADPIRVLFLADSHLGFDLPVRPTKVARRRRGHDFLANYAEALAPALAGEVDLVVHGGDVFDRPGVIATLAYQAFEPLVRIADRGIPVVLVPGNHERSRLPHLRFAAHPRIHVFGEPRTFVLELRGRRVALAGFPYCRRNVRTELPALIEATGWRPDLADHHLLCLHHCVEGATVGPVSYTFRSASDVIRPEQVPPAFAAVLSGHIHRHQVLTRSLSGKRLTTPVLYPGSIERTALAEIGEPKGYLMLRLGGAGDASGSELDWAFRPLYARPMIRERLVATGQSPRALEEELLRLVASAPADAVLSVRVEGELTDAHRRRLSARRLRAIGPATMNLELGLGEVPFRRGARRAEAPRAVAEQLTLGGPTD
jgi:DNA repair protein SbcD/Mre11